MKKGNSQVLSGFCPNPHCQKKLFFPENEASVECSGCGQRHVQSSLQNLEKAFNHPGLVEAVEGLLLQLRKFDASRKKTLEQENYKINGLSNCLCSILSSLLTTHGMDKNSGKAKLLTEMGKAPVFDCGQLCDRSFLIDPAHLNISGFGRDRSGSSVYLGDTLNVIKLSNDNEERLIPVHADGDGHCLLHSISRALVGWELFWHPLMVNLKQHFIQNLGKYKMQFRDFIDDSEWRMIVEECDPDFTPSGSEPTGLRNIHIFGLANVLRRPIILLDSMEGIQSPGDYSAIFLPIFSSPAACKNKDGVLNKPLCIAWSSLGRNHFIPLVGVQGKKCPVLSRHMIQRAWGVSDVEIDKYVHFENGHCQVGGEKGLQIGYVQRLVMAMSEVFQQQHGVSASLVTDVYQHIFKANGFVFGVNLAVLVEKTQSCTADQQLFVCVGCHCLAFAQPLEDDTWCLPNGELYDLAVSCHGTLKDGQSYSFPIHDIIAKYDKAKDRLIPVKGSRKPSGCLYCSGIEFRLVKGDYAVLYQNGDRTQTKSSVCSCGFKHFWNGNEYDTAPKQLLVLMEWGGRTVKEIVPWFQNEQDPSLNSNVYQMAQDLVQKNFPGEFGSERLVQKVVDQILMQTDSPTKVEELKTLVQKHNRDGASSSTSSSSNNTVAASSLPTATAVKSPSTAGGGGADNGDTQMEVGDDDVTEQQQQQQQDRMGVGSGAWSVHQPSKAIITGRQTQSIHKEELNMSNAERQAKQRIEKNAAIQQRKSPIRQKLSPSKTFPTPKSPVTSPPPPPPLQPRSTTSPTTQQSAPSSHSLPLSPSSSSTSSDFSTTTKTTATTPTKSTPPPAPPPNMANKRIRLATSDGRNLTLDLPAQCSFLELQSLVHKTVGVPPERQKIRHGFPPMELKAPSQEELDYRVPVQPGDKIMLDILQDQKKKEKDTSNSSVPTPTTTSVSSQDPNTTEGGGGGGSLPYFKSSKSAWNSFASPSSSSDDANEASDLVIQRLMDPLLGSGGDNLDRTLSALALTAALEQKDLWTYVQRMPHLFSVDGLFYKQVERDMGLEHGKHCTLPLLSHKVFVYNGQDDRLELCLEPYGHFPIENKVESKAQSLLPTSHCRSKTSHTPFSGQGHSLRSVSSQEDRMPTDVPMSPKRLEARRLNTMCDPSIHQESIEEEDEDDDNVMNTEDSSDQNNTPPHLLRPEELTRQSPPSKLGGATTTLHIPGPDSKLIRRGPGYSELSPIPENSSNEKSEMLHQLVNRIEQAVKNMGQDAEKVGGQHVLNASSSDSRNNANNNPYPVVPTCTSSSFASSHSTSGCDVNASSISSLHSPSSSSTSLPSPSFSPSSSHANESNKSTPLLTTTGTMSSPTATTSSSLPHAVSFPSPSAILLSSSIMAEGSSRNSSTNSSRRNSDNEKESPMTGGVKEWESPALSRTQARSRSRSSSSSSTSSLSPSPLREENPMDTIDHGDEVFGGGGGRVNEVVERRNRVAEYAEEVASSLMAMDDDFNQQNNGQEDLLLVSGNHSGDRGDAGAGNGYGGGDSGGGGGDDVSSALQQQDSHFDRGVDRKVCDSHDDRDRDTNMTTSTTREKKGEKEEVMDSTDSCDATSTA